MANQKMGVKVKRVASIILGVAIGLSGCGGSSTNNDQGTSFLARNYVRVLPDGTLTNTGLTGFAVSIKDSAVFAAGMVLENRLTTQFMRVTQISCGYTVPGSSVSLYQDSYNSSFVISPNNSTGTIGFYMISPDVMAYFANRVNELPPFPFRMNIECQATAISQSGDVFQSNPLGIQAIITDDDTIVEEDDTGNAVVDEAAIDESLVEETEDDTESSSSSTSAL